MILCNHTDNLDILRKKLYFYIRKYILSPLLKENEEKDKISKEIEKYMSDVNNELPDDRLIEMVENEYNEIFNKYNNEEEQKEDKEEMKIEEKEEKEKEKEKSEQKEKKENKNIEIPEEYTKCMEKFR